MLSAPEQTGSAGSSSPETPPLPPPKGTLILASLDASLTLEGLVTVKVSWSHTGPRHVNPVPPSPFLLGDGWEDRLFSREVGDGAQCQPPGWAFHWVGTPLRAPTQCPVEDPSTG